MSSSTYLSRKELETLTSFEQPKRMCEWLYDHGWVFEPPARRGGLPVVARAHYDDRLSGNLGDRPNSTAGNYVPRRPKVWHTPARMESMRAIRQESAERERSVAIATTAHQAWLQANQGMIEREKAEDRAALVRHHTAKRRAAKLKRTPPWADIEAIRTIYEEARRLTVATGTQHHADHDIPLQGDLVSGLHVHNNLQILTGPENSRKRNRFEVV